MLEHMQELGINRDEIGSLSIVMLYVVSFILEVHLYKCLFSGAGTETVNTYLLCCLICH